MQPLPKLTLEAAADLANRYRTIAPGLIDLFARGDQSASIDHAAHAASALLVVFEHATKLEQSVGELVAQKENLTRVIEGIVEATRKAGADPETGDLFRALLGAHIKPIELAETAVVAGETSDLAEKPIEPNREMRRNAHKMIKKAMKPAKTVKKR